MEYSYTPYRQKRNTEKKSKFKLPKIKLPGSFKKWAALIVGVIAFILFLLYLSLGELRFFANHYLGLTFFSKNYLVVLQNDYELRPGGGFVTSYGELDTFLGFPTNLSFKNSYDIDTTTYVTPPVPHEELLKNEWYQGYTFRDANWDPDFRNSSAELINFYQQKFPERDVDGVIVMNFSMIEELVDALGGVELNGKTLTKDNLFSELEFEVNNIDRHNIKALANRKNILGELGNVLVRKMKRSPYKTKRVVIDALHNKNLYLWLESNRLQNKLIEKGWANVLDPVDRSDFLAVNLANLGSKKADRYVRQEVHYYANITKELPEINTEITIRYPGFTNTHSDNYKGYLRLYLPKDADVTSVPVDSEEFLEGDFKIIGTKIILPAGSKTALNYVYTLPRNTFLRDEYKLRLVKQSGSQALYNVTVETGEGKLLQSDKMLARENRANFEGRLINDVDLEAKILPDQTPPYPIEQVFAALNKINIIWNEPMDSSEATNPDNYSIADLNKNDENTDVVQITEAALIQPNVIQLTLDGVTKQELEHYRIDMKGLEDQNGNLILPNPKPITAVQRLSPASETDAFELGAIPDTEEQPALEE